MVVSGSAFRVGYSVAAAPGSCECAKCERVAGRGCNCAVEASSRKKFELPRRRQTLVQERTSPIHLQHHELHPWEGEPLLLLSIDTS
jgi:hypothetical protein